VVGTMDVLHFDWFSESLLSQTSIIDWTNSGDPTSGEVQTPAKGGGGREFLRSSIRDMGSARGKLQRILKHPMQAAQILFTVQSVLIRHGVAFSTRSVTREALLFLANAWSLEMHGLFHREPEQNLEIALDLVISQMVLPRGWRTINRSAALREELNGVLGDRFPCSHLFLKRAEGGHG